MGADWQRRVREDAGEPAVGGAGEAVPEEKTPCAAEKCSPLRVPGRGNVSYVLWSSVRTSPWIQGTERRGGKGP